MGTRAAQGTVPLAALATPRHWCLWDGIYRHYRSASVRCYRFADDQGAVTGQAGKRLDPSDRMPAETTLSEGTAGSATRPSGGTNQDDSSERPTHIQWVFPSSILMSRQTGRHVIGREESCDTALGGTDISRRHAEFWIDGPVWAVRDLESLNGVFVNGVRRADAPLSRGDVIRCGEWIGVVVSDAAAGSFGEVVPGWFGGSALRAAVEPLRRVGAELPIIVEGETGTGKEGASRIIHAWSHRRGPFVAVNCAALPAQLSEAELFGYRKGAFTGADLASQGLFRAANGGTIFLDEILDLPPTIQPKLLRVLEQREVLPLGETKPVPIDVRVIAATQEPLSSAVKDRRFRPDLHARLDGLTIVLPPLRNRREDITPLFQEFLRQEAGEGAPRLDAKLVETLCVYDWPLNVRELLLLARRLLAVHGPEALLTKKHLPERMLVRTDAGVDGAEQPKRRWRSTDDKDQLEALLAALRAHDGSVARAAAAIGINRGRAYRLLDAHPDATQARAGRQS